MGLVSGTAGSVIIGGTAGTIVGNIDEWNGSFEMELIDANAFGVAWEQYIPGIKNFNGSFTGKLNDSDAMQILARNATLSGTSVALILAAGTTRYSIGTAYIPSFSLTVNLRGETTEAFNFQSSGPVTIV
jgi:hypothetical protein